MACPYTFKTSRSTPEVTTSMRESRLGRYDGHNSMARNTLSSVFSQAQWSHLKLDSLRNAGHSRESGNPVGPRRCALHGTDPSVLPGSRRKDSAQSAQSKTLEVAEKTRSRLCDLLEDSVTSVLRTFFFGLFVPHLRYNPP